MFGCLGVVLETISRRGGDRIRCNAELKYLFHEGSEDCLQPCYFDELLTTCGPLWTAERMIE